MVSKYYNWQRVFMFCVLIIRISTYEFLRLIYTGNTTRRKVVILFYLLS